MTLAEEDTNMHEVAGSSIQDTDGNERHTDRRKVVRVSCRIPVTVTSQHGKMAMEVRDLSHVGARLTGTCTLLVGEMVYFTFSVPDDEDCHTQRDLHCFARVVWEAGRGHGVEFVAMRKIDRMRLQEFVQGMIPWWRHLFH